MREVVGKDGKVYTIFEFLEPVPPSTVELFARDMERKEKKSREQDWKLRARYNYRKK